MTNLIGIYDHSTGENVAREMTKQEIQQRVQEIQNWTLAKEQALIETNTLLKNKIDAYKKLGLTDMEIEALLPVEKPKIPFND